MHYALTSQSCWLTADRYHFAAGLIVFPEIMLLRFPIDHIQEELAQLRIRRTSPERTQDIELERAAETRTQFSIAGESKLVAALTEMKIGHCTDETDALFAA